MGKRTILMLALVLVTGSWGELDEEEKLEPEMAVTGITPTDEAETTTTSTEESTSSSSTTSSTTTTTTTKKSTPASTKRPKKDEAPPSNEPPVYNHTAFRAGPFCTCDLTPSSCDVNCCCDLDCSGDDAAAFSGCTHVKPHNVDPRYCYKTEFIYGNNSQVIIICFSLSPAFSLSPL